MDYLQILKIIYTNLLLNKNKIILFLLFIQLTSCESAHNNNKLLIFDGLSLIKGNKLGHPKDNQVFLVRYLNFDCSSCVHEIIHWQNFIERNNIDLEKSLFIVGYGDYERLILVIETIKFDGNILYDRNEIFYKNNSSIHLKGDKGILIKNDHYNEIQIDFENALFYKQVIDILELR